MPPTTRSYVRTLPSPRVLPLPPGSDRFATDAKGQDYLERQDIIGSVVGYIPFVGYVTIMLSEHPWMKTAMLGIMGVFVVLQRE